MSNKGKNHDKNLRIIFMGTPEFAVPSLDILVTAGYNIIAVITSPDRLGGRGRKKLIESDIKKYAETHNLKVLQPPNLKDKTFVEELKQLRADLQIVVAFRMLPEVVWNMPPLGTYNLHGSLLPAYRGAAPINWAIIKGESETGVTSFKLKHEIDTGSVLIQEKINIYPSDDAGSLHDRMKYYAADVVLRTVQLLSHREVDLVPQDETQVSKAPKLNLENTEIDTNKSLKEILNFIRGLNPYPQAWTRLGDKIMKVSKAEGFSKKDDLTPGTFISDNKSYLMLKVKDGYIDMKEFKYTGKRKMKVEEFLNGFDVTGMARLVNKPV